MEILFALGVLGGSLLGAALTASVYKKKMWEFKKELLAVKVEREQGK
jgi:hypothetical protein